MSYFCKNVIFFILVQAIAITLLIHSSSCEFNKGHHDDINKLSPWLITWHLHVVNGLSNGRILLVHCKSKDDDLGIHNLTADTEFTWKFKPNFFGGTLFWCYMAHSNFHAAFDAFRENDDFFQECNYGDCIWTAKDDGIYLRNGKLDKLTYGWEQGRLW
uniref:S-protein homolog n=2 Tax=Gossypium raimondii TaxID=29730 RepID=A0A0D2N2B1_GOSRA|nr:hypothetical protein B456_004G224600 [Gossypium raimondii]